MTKAATKGGDFQGGLFYKTEESLLKEITRFLDTRRNNRGATEWQIHHVVNNRPFVEALEQARRCSAPDRFRTKREELNFYTGLRRCAVFPVVKKLLNEGYTVAEISDALTMPYSTIYYYAKKIKNHKRLRDDRTRWHIDKATDCIAAMKVPKDKAAALAKKEVMQKARDKRARKAEKLRAISEKQRTKG